MAIAITGASGALGRAAAEFVLQVLQSTDPTKVVLSTRNPDSLADFASRGASVRRADFSDPANLATAFAGVDKLLLISTDAGGARLDQHLAAISAASQAGVRHIAYTSISQPISANPALVVADHAATEQAIKDSGGRCCATTCTRTCRYPESSTPPRQAGWWPAAVLELRRTSPARTAPRSPQPCLPRTVTRTMCRTSPDRGRGAQPTSPRSPAKSVTERSSWCRSTTRPTATASLGRASAGRRRTPHLVRCVDPRRFPRQGQPDRRGSDRSAGHRAGRCRPLGIEGLISSNGTARTCQSAGGE